jgi:hypothetical protein
LRIVVLNVKEDAEAVSPADGVGLVPSDEIREDGHASMGAAMLA